MSSLFSTGSASARKREQELADLDKIEKGRKFAKRFLPSNWRLLGVSPGYLFIAEPRGSIDLPDDVVDTMIERFGAVDVPTPAQPLQPLHERHPYDVEGSEWLPETCIHPSRGGSMCRECALLTVRRLATALRADVPPPQPPDSKHWRVIITAPTDEQTPVLCWTPHVMAVAYFDNGDWWILGSRTVIEPTHWMPLPYPPFGGGDPQDFAQPPEEKP